MSMKLRGAASGSYNVRATEMARDRPVAKTVRCVVHFLDDTEAAFEIDKRAKAQSVLEKVFEHLELVERDYFGLQFVDTGPTPDGMLSDELSNSYPTQSTETMRWLDPLKTLKKQMRGPPFLLFFRVKFYVSDPSKLQEEYTRYHFFLQLKKDIMEGRLVVPYQSAVLLASYAVQSELGDHNVEDHTVGYLSQFRFIPSQTEQFEEDVSTGHRDHRGQTPADAEFNYLDSAKRLDMYGVDLHRARVRDQSNLEIQLGVTSAGLVVFQNNIKINTFSWAKIVKISFKRKQFFIQLRRENQSENVENLIGFNMVSYRSCKNLWKSCVEHHTFFRLNNPPVTKNTLLSLGSKFRYSGRTEFQTVEDGKRRARIERSFTRSPSKRYARRTVGATTRDAIVEERNTIDGYRNVPQSQSADNFRSSEDYINKAQSPTRTIPNSTSYPHNLRSTPYNNNNSVPATGVFEHTNHIRKTLPTDYKPNDYVNRNGNSARQTPQKTVAAAVTPAIPSSTGHGTNSANSSRSGTLVRNAVTSSGRSQTSPSKTPMSSLMEPERIPRSLEANKVVDYNKARTVDRVDPRTIKAYDGRPDSRMSRTFDARSVDTRSNGTQSDTISMGKVSDYNTDSLRSARSLRSHDPAVVTTKRPGFTGTDDESVAATEQSYELPNYNDYNLPNGTAFNDGQGLVTIRIQPDKQGRFGFNVKGGADQGMPIIVSRVAPETPADVCIPRLNEGDQVLFINGRDVSQHTHEQVVMFIRASRELHSGELVLVVRPNVYIGEETPDEPDFQYIPDTHHITTTSLPPGGDQLAASLMLLQESLDSNAALAQFEQLYRKKPGTSTNAARYSENLAKNRYRDISPYDQTRVKVNGVNGDYINANFVNMEIQGSGIVNRYVAAQGPLPNTCSDFWQMVWEQQSRLIVMLTTKVERGRVKCHQYWPELYETASFSHLQVTCVKEEAGTSFAFREFTLVNLQAGQEERHIRQMQYISWPDHGVPDDSGDFLHFVTRVRQSRLGMVEPTIVHCSAGIGRTGVLITMESAMCLIEANQPIYPLDIVRQMRDQRAMLIQTSSQYKFVCEAILRVYNEKLIQPLEDYTR